MDVKQEAVDDFLEHKNALMDKMVWSGDCRSWYGILPDRMREIDIFEKLTLRTGTKTERLMDP